MKPTESNVTNLASSIVLDTWYALELERGICAVQHLWSVLNSSSSCVDEFLNEDLSENPVCLFAEDGTEDDSHSIMTGLDVNSLLLSVLDDHDVPSLLDSLWRIFGCELRGLFCQSVVLIEGILEWCSHCVSL